MSREPDLSGARLFAGLAVSDLEVSSTWFEKLVGTPGFEPDESERVWTLSDRCHLYIEIDPAAAGHSRVTIFVEDFPGFVARAARHGLHPTSRETYGNGVQKATYEDPDGNQVGIGGDPS